jgi:hypothetical protein
VKGKIISLVVGLLLISLLNVPITAAQEVEEVESGLDGITDF